MADHKRSVPGRRSRGRRGLLANTSQPRQSRIHTSRAGDYKPVRRCCGILS